MALLDVKNVRKVYTTRFGGNHKFRNQSKRRRTDRRNYKEYDKEKSYSANFTDTFSYGAIYNSI